MEQAMDSWENGGGASQGSPLPSHQGQPNSATGPYKANSSWRLANMMKIRPLYDRIVVKRIEEQETLRSGIIIPDSAKEKPQEGEVVAVGQGKRLENGAVVAPDST